MKVAIYCRLSEEDRDKLNEKDESNSIQNQKSMLLKYAFEQDWEVYNIYSDDDYTGADRKRPQFNTLLEDAKNHKFDIILCKTQSRFTRELELVEKYIHGLFPLWGIRFISIVDNADTDNKGNKKSRQINGLVNEWYLEDMSENIKSVLINRRKEGKHIGAFALYGYKKDPNEKGHLIIDEEAAEVVREVYNLFASGIGKTAIARNLNDRGIPNPTEYKRLHGLRWSKADNKNSTLWKYYAISDMLTNEMYIGNMVQGKYGSVSYKTKENKPRPKSDWYKVEGTHEPIIEKELWDRVQEMVKERSKPFSSGSIGIFSKKLKCKNCGYTMRSKITNHKRRFICSNRFFSKDSCSGTSISESKLEDMVIKELHRISEEYLDKDELERNIDFTNNLKIKKDKINKNISSYETKLSEYKNGIKNLYLDKVKGLINDSEFVDLSKDFNLEKDRFSKLIEDSKNELEKITNQIESAKDKSEIIEKYMNIQHLTREMVMLLIDYIEIGKHPKGSYDTPIEIHWNF